MSFIKLAFRLVEERVVANNVNLPAAIKQAEIFFDSRAAESLAFRVTVLFSGNDALELYLIEWLRGHFPPNQPVADGVTKWRQILRRVGPRRFTAVSRSVLVRQMLEG